MDKITKSLSQDIFKLIKNLFPICRSITGEGNRQTLLELKKIINLQIKEIESGTKVFDWVIPNEWNINDAYIKNPDGEKIVDFKKSNLHVVNYSTPINAKMPLEELQEHLYSIEEKPELIPYRTTYYEKNWGFCLSHNKRKKLKEGLYEVVIDSKLHKGTLTYGELFIKGERSDEVLISTHICHPSMCNDNLTGISVNTFLANYLTKQKLKYSYRFIFIPATIGAVTWLAINEKKLSNIKYGLVTALLGDSGQFNFKKSRNEYSSINKIVKYVLANSEYEYKILDFSPYGYDERQFCSPGINLPVGRLTRTPNNEFPEYHTSADNLSFISHEKLFESFCLLLEIIKTIELNDYYKNLYPKCEPQLGKRGIYKSIAGNINEMEYALLWILNYSDGNHDLIDISELSKIKLGTLAEASKILLNNKLIKTI